jgi:tetratricopeptide (TPR) repeat protein
MVQRAFISRFSPNRTDPKTLEAIFVQRHTLLDAWLQRLRDSILTDNKSHLLAIGPRGSGKSHLVNLLVHRLQQDPAISPKARVAWLPEDEATSSFWKFLLRILRALSAAYPSEFPSPPRDQMEKGDEAEKTQILTDHLLKHLAKHTLLLVVENLDDVMRGLTPTGQKRWRSFLQQHPVTTTLATAQQLPKDIASREGAFFNFFDVQHLKPLSTQEALQLLIKIATHTNNADLLSFLQSPTGQARIRAIRHLTGGSHRVFIILSEFATRENLDNLVGAFEELLDELTPYYQERLRWLPDQQREIVEFLCRQNHTVPVKEIAKELFLSEQAAAAQLKSLRDKGYVGSDTIGRESRYRLSEPLMRLCVEVKDPTREPIRLIVEFLRIWYEPATIESRLLCLPESAHEQRRYLQAVFSANSLQHPLPIDAEFDRELEVARTNKYPEEIASLLLDMLATATTAARCNSIGSELSKLNKTKDANSAYQKAVSYIANNAEQWRAKSDAFCSLYQFHEAINALDSAIALAPNDLSLKFHKGIIQRTFIGIQPALTTFKQMLLQEPCDACAIIFHTQLLMDLNLPEQALPALENCIKEKPDVSIFYLLKTEVLQRCGRHKEALRTVEYALSNLTDPTLSLYLNRANVNLALRDPRKSIIDYTYVISKTPNDDEALDGLIKAHVEIADWPLAKTCLTHWFKARSNKSTSITQTRLSDILFTLFNSSDAVPLNKRVAEITQIAADSKLLPLLAKALVQGLKQIQKGPSINIALWVDAWQQAAQSHPDLSLSVRIFTVGVAYLKDKDPRVLLDLLPEERVILQDLFNLKEEEPE